MSTKHTASGKPRLSCSAPTKQGSLRSPVECAGTLSLPQENCGALLVGGFAGGLVVGDDLFLQIAGDLFIALEFDRVGAGAMAQ